MKRNLIALLAVGVAACAPSDRQSGDTASGSVSGSSRVALTGAGATFPYPIYSKWFSDYATQTGVKINYQSIGSGGGIRQLTEGTVDFGATDSPMSDTELASAKGGAILHIPTVMGAVVATYNVPGISQPLKLTGEVLADIFLGRIRRWNDARLAALNADAPLPNTDILVVHRSDGSGTTYIFTDYLSNVSPAWKGGPGTGKEVQWPAGLGAKGNEGVAGQVKQTPGSIGYVELAYAKQNRLPFANMQNSSGEFVTPTIESVTAAAAGVMARLPEDTDYRISIVNAPGRGAYPIASFTWIILYREQPDADKGQKLVDFLRWALREGGPSAAALDYAPLPQEMVARLEQRLSTVAIGARA
ncbi:MAG TPA: phosphate ABC transporter substrate-binding protein PstS [Gemmatimonadaceae bacterium]|nr:phosphate ABC transporter substrate-binding protein PstS [Gemmatimonadaceae bacterium]